MKYGILTKQQIEEYIKFLYKKDEPNITDFAIAGGGITDEKGIHGLLAGRPETDDNNEDIYIHIPNCDKFNSIKEPGITNDEVFFIPFLSTDILSEDYEIKMIDKRFGEIKFGVYPQSRKNYVAYLVPDTLYRKFYYPYHGKVWLKCTKEIQISDGRYHTYECIECKDFKSNVGYYIFEPIKWIVDTKKNIMFTKKAMFSGISIWKYWFYADIKYLESHSDIYIFLRDYFLPNIISNEKMLQEIISDDNKNSKNIKRDDLLESVKEKIKESKINACDSNVIKQIENYNQKQYERFKNELIEKEAIITKKFTDLNKILEGEEQLLKFSSKKIDDVILNKSADLDKKLSVVAEEQKKILEQSEKQVEEKILSVSKLFDEEVQTLYRNRKKLEDEIKDEVIKKVVEFNPVKQVNIFVNNVKINEVKGIIHKSFASILKLVSIKMPIFLVGPAGCGKNVIVKQCSQALGKKFYYQNDAEEDHKLLGFVDANGVYHKTPFYEAFKQGGLLMVDEMDNSNASVLLKLNSAIGTGDDFYMTFPNGEQIEAHKDFQVVAAANTYGTGSNQVYCGRNQIDGATLDRYFVYNVDYDQELERALVTNKEILDLYWDIRRIVKENDIRHTVSTRGILNMDKILSGNIIDDSFTLGDAFDGTLIKGLDVDDLNIIVSKITSHGRYTFEFLNHLKNKYEVNINAYQENNVNNEFEYMGNGFNNNNFKNDGYNSGFNNNESDKSDVDKWFESGDFDSYYKYIKR